MNKKNQQPEKKWMARCWAVALTQQCHDRQQQAAKTTQRRHSPTIEQKTLAAVLADKTALLDERLSLVGYLHIMCMLLKIALTNKKINGRKPVLFLRAYVEQCIPSHTTATAIEKHP